MIVIGRWHHFIPGGGIVQHQLAHQPYIFEHRQGTVHGGHGNSVIQLSDFLVKLFDVGVVISFGQDGYDRRTLRRYA